jgi:hypothetical protein
MRAFAHAFAPPGMGPNSDIVAVAINSRPADLRKSHAFLMSSLPSNA